MGAFGVGFSTGGACVGVGSGAGDSVGVAAGSGVFVDVGLGATGTGEFVGVEIIEATGDELAEGGF